MRRWFGSARQDSDTEADDSPEAHLLGEPAANFGEKEKPACPGVDAATVVQKLNSGLLWKSFVLILLGALDRSSLAYAARQLNEDLGFSNTVYGLGSSIFFFGSVLFQVPSNLMLIRVGARRWLSFIVISWGTVAVSFGLMRTESGFLALRFLLGCAEAGIVPGLWYHLQLFYEGRDLALAWATVQLGFPVSTIVGGPLAAMILSMDGFWGVPGWRWLFILEGIPSVIMGVYVFYTVADSPQQAMFLRPEERAWLVQRHATQASDQKDAGGETRPWGALTLGRTWHLVAIQVLEGFPKMALVAWTPLIIGSLTAGGSKQKDIVVALLTSLPAATAATTLIANSMHSKVTGEQRWHATLPSVVMVAAYAALAYLMSRSPLGSFLALCLVQSGWSGDGIIKSWPATFLQGPAAANGFAFIHTVGMAFGGWGPYVIGRLKDVTGNHVLAMTILSVMTAVNCVLLYTFPIRLRSSKSGGEELDVVDKKLKGFASTVHPGLGDV